MTYEKSLRRRFEAFLDIETTGLSPRYSRITVVGIYLHNGRDGQFTQLVGEDITSDSLLHSLSGVDIIYTYNGSRFDLPYIHYQLGVNLTELFRHYDLMYACWSNSLKGGLKCVERQLGIERQEKNVDGFEAVKLWRRYIDQNDDEALATLLRYNREDVLNLKTLREILAKRGRGKRDS
jgi:uncharacterized protein YprB with RNaseH-like and TPR domain